MWTRSGSLHVPSGRLSISDSSFFYEFPLIVDVPPGSYVIEAVRTQEDGYDLLERLRLRDVVGGEPRRGEHLGLVKVEFAQLGLCDRARAEAEFAGLDVDGRNAFTSQFSISTLTGVARLPDGTEMFLVKPGSGDLDSAVFELLRDGRRCGVELVFVEPDARMDR